jgi:hypothetical protein
MKSFHGVTCPCKSYIRGDRTNNIMARKGNGIPGNQSSIPDRDGNFIHIFGILFLGLIQPPSSFTWGVNP